MNTDKAQEKYHMLRNEYTDQELEVELERRKKENTKPVMLDEPDLRELKGLVQSIINDIADGSYHEDSDDRHYIYEAAMTGFFGKDIFKWLNANT